MQSVVQFVKMLSSEGCADEFEDRAKKSKAFVSLDGDNVEFVNEFFTQNNQLRTAMVAHIREPCPDNPFKC